MTTASDISRHMPAYTGRVRRHTGRASVLALVLTLAGVGPPALAADDLELSFAEGRVTVVATNVPVTAILMEWARVGGTRFVDAEALAGPPVTLELRDVPEGEALRVLLRAATGYVAAPRSLNDSGVSSFDRVLIMAAARRPKGSARTYEPTLTPPSARQLTGQPSLGQTGPADATDFGQPGSNTLIETSRDDGLELIESLRRRYQTPPAPVSVFGQPGAVATGQAAPGSETGVQTAPRPGMIITPEQPAGSGRSVPVRPQVGDPSR